MTTFTDPFRIMYQEVPSSPWLNTRYKKMKRLMTRVEAHQYKLQLIKSSFLSPQNYAFNSRREKKITGKYELIHVEYYFLFFRM